MSAAPIHYSVDAVDSASAGHLPFYQSNLSSTERVPSQELGNIALNQGIFIANPSLSGMEQAQAYACSALGNRLATHAWHDFHACV
jgi:hypothetical protein